MKVTNSICKLPTLFLYYRLYLYPTVRQGCGADQGAAGLWTVGAQDRHAPGPNQPHRSEYLYQQAGASADAEGLIGGHL